MKKNLCKFTGAALAVAAMALSAGAQAQSTSTTSGSGGMMSNWSGTSWYPTGSRYIGLNAGRGDIGGSCLIDCDDTSDVYSLYTGGMWNKNFGLELGATDFRDFDRGLGSNASAYGFSVKAVGVIPLTQSFSAFAKAGTIYARTKGSVDGLTPGARDSHWGSTYGVGVNFDFTPSLAAVLEYDQSNLRFAGDREHVNTTSLGLKYRF